MNDAQREALREAAQQYLDGGHEDSSVNRSVAAMFASNIIALLAESEPVKDERLAAVEAAVAKMKALMEIDERVGGFTDKTAFNAWNLKVTAQYRAGCAALDALIPGASDAYFFAVSNSADMDRKVAAALKAADAAEAAAKAAKAPVSAPEVTDPRDGTFCLNPKPHKPHVYTACPDLYMQPTRNCPGLVVDSRIENLKWVKKNVEAWPGSSSLFEGTREMVLLLIEELERYRLLS